VRAQSFGKHDKGSLDWNFASAFVGISNCVLFDNGCFHQALAKDGEGKREDQAGGGKLLCCALVSAGEDVTAVQTNAARFALLPKTTSEIELP
jgi:hypothetical protein